MALSADKRAYHREWYRKNKERRLLRNREIARKSYRKNKDRRRNDPHFKQQRRKHQIKSYYGLTWDEYLKLSQCCEICGSADRLHVDHDHSGDRRVRGRLCSKCNKGIGLFSDNTELLKRAIQYLERTN